jgi:7-cyano-7-deazaguanine synthase
MTATVLVYSGGLDSTTLLYDLRAQGHTLRALGVDYGQRHARELVAYAAHRGDHPVYPDCRPAFVDAARAVLALVHYTPVALLAPYLALTKADLVRRGAALGVPYGETWSCYVGGAVHCGACGTCVERRLAFIEAGTTDPTRYADPAPVAG